MPSEMDKFKTLVPMEKQKRLNFGLFNNYKKQKKLGAFLTENEVRALTVNDLKYIIRVCKTYTLKYS